MIPLPRPYRGQFTLSRSSVRSLLDADQSEALGGWTLRVGADLPVIAVFCSDGQQIGWILGHPIHPKSGLINSLAMDCTSSQLNFDVLEEALYDLGGRYACIVISGSSSRVYLDPCGSLAVVYSLSESVVASTTTLIPESRESPAAVVDSYLKASGGTPPLCFPAGLTHRADVRRLLPNHALDLDSFQSKRHFPSRRMERRLCGEEVGDLVSAIAAGVRGNVEPLVRNGITPLCGLTAGRDTRVILAACRDLVDQMSFYTGIYEGRNGSIDQHLAVRMAHHLGLQHQWLPIEEVTEEHDAAYQKVTGYSGLTKARFRDSCERHLDLRQAFIWGPGGEIARAYFWRRGDEERGEIAAAEMLERMHFANSPEFLQAMEEWLEEVHGYDLLQQLDLAYIEHKHGGWCGPHMYGLAPFRMVILPFCHLRIHEAMMQLPSQYCRSFQLAVDVVRESWPELLKFPFNRYMGLRRYVDGISRRVLVAARHD